MKVFVIYILLLLSFISSMYGNEKVTLQLKWFHQFQFAGYYAAKEKGFYDEVGLDVDIKQRDIRFNNVEQVINNEAQYGISDSILMLYKAKKQPVVVVSPIFQHSPSVLIALKSSGISSPYELNKKNMIFYPNDTDGFSILAMLKKLNIKPNIIRKREKNDYLKLINKEVDLTPAYLSNEPFYFQERNIGINIINPMNYGFDLYGDMLFTNQNEVEKHPLRVKRFKEATLKGWKYALNNKEEIIQLIHKKYNKTKSIEHLRFEANAIEQLILKDTIPLGTIDRGRIQYTYNLYEEYGLSKDKFEIQDFIFEEYVNNHHSIDLTKEEKEYLKNNPILKVQNLSSFPPYNFNENNKVLGYSVDYVRLIGKVLGIQVEFITGKTWEESLVMLKNKQLDLIPGVAITEERKKFITYTDINNFNYQVALGVIKESGINSFDDLKDKTISVLKNTFLHRILQDKYPNQKLLATPTVKEAVEAVASGKADAVIDNLATVEYYKNSGWLGNLKTLKMDQVAHIPQNTGAYFGIAKDNYLLKSILEKANSSLSFNELLSLQKKWLNVKSENTIQWNDEELAYLKQKKELKYCINPNWLPFEKIENEQHIGMTSQYIKEFENNLPISMKIYKTQEWTDTIESAKNRKCDFVTIMMDTNERRKEFNFTQNIMDMPLVIATKQDKPFINDISDVLSETFAIVKGFAYIEVLKKQYPSIKIVEVKDIYDGLSKVNKGSVYGCIGVLPVIGYNIQEHFLGNLKIDGKLQESVGLPIATRNDEPILKDIFNKLINNISAEKNQEILNKWLSIKYEEQMNYKLIFYIVSVFLVIILTVIIKNRAINKVNLEVKQINNRLSEYIEVVDENVLTSTTDKRGVITYVSQAFCDISGYTKAELIGKRHNIIRHPDTPKELFEDLWSTIISGKTWKGEIKNKNKNGTFYWVDAVISPIFDDDKNIIGYTAIRHDITNKKLVEELAIKDELTKLYNKRYFNEVFEKELNRAKRDNHTFGLMILDIDFFKQYNDNYGHQKGDYVLEEVGKELQKICQRSSDIAYRIGGEEFAITFTQYFEEDAVKFAKLVNESIEALNLEHKYNKASDYITVSIGLYTDSGEKLANMKEIYHFADLALYQAKESGRNQAILYKDKDLS